MTSIRFLFLLFVGPLLLSLVDTCTGSSVPTNDATILKVPTEKKVTHGGGRRLGEQLSKYFERTSGLCTDGGGSYIGTIEDCDEGAGLLGWSDTTASTESASRYPPGCFKYNNLYFNTDTSSTKPCSSSKKCLCKLTGTGALDPGASPGASKDTNSFGQGNLDTPIMIGVGAFLFLILVQVIRKKCCGCGSSRTPPSQHFELKVNNIPPGSKVTILVDNVKVDV